MHPALSRGVRTFCLIFGTIEAIWAAFWCFLGPRLIYELSTPPIMRGRELAYLAAIILTGPLSALPATVVALSRPRWGAAWLIVGAMASGALSLASLFTTYTHVVPIPGVLSLPMLIVGLWLIRKSATATGSAADTKSPIETEVQQGGEIGSILLGVVLFVAGWFGTYAILIALAINNVTGLRGPPRRDNPFVCENADFADCMVLLLVLVAVSVISFVRKRLHLRGELLAGMWFALAVGGLMLVLR